MKENKTDEKAPALNDLGFALIVARAKAAQSQPCVVGTAAVLTSDERPAERAKIG